MGFTAPARKLSRQRPPERLMSLGIWLPVLLQFATCAFFQVGGRVGGSGSGYGRLALVERNGFVGAVLWGWGAPHVDVSSPALLLCPAPNGPCRPPPPPASPSARCLPIQVAALVLLSRQPWYEQFDPHPTGTNCFDRTQANSAACSQSYENSAVFLVSLGQFLIAAFVFNKGPPFRRPIYTNLWLLLGERAELVGVMVERKGVGAWWRLAPGEGGAGWPAHPKSRPAFVAFLSPPRPPLPLSACPATLSFQTLLLAFSPPPPPSSSLPAALSFQTLLLAFLILAPSTPVSHDFAGLLALPLDFRSQLCLLLLANLAVSWLADGAASVVFERLKGRRVCGLMVE